MYEYGLQLYSVRDIAKKDYEAALRGVAEMGYKKVESAGFFGLPAAEVGAMLRHYGLQLCSTHTDLDELETDFEGTVTYHKALGCADLIVPGVSFRTKEKLDHSIELLNRFRSMLEAEGIRMHYHNHYQEFLPNEDGIIPMEELVGRTSLFLEIDTFWTLNAGLDPLATLEKYRDRILFIHLQDGQTQDLSDPKSRAVGCSLGLGRLPVQQVRDKAMELGAQIVVESEGLDPTGLEEVRRCIDFLRTID